MINNPTSGYLGCDRKQKAFLQILQQESGWEAALFPSPAWQGWEGQNCSPCFADIEQSEAFSSLCLAPHAGRGVGAVLAAEGGSGVRPRTA